MKFFATCPKGLEILLVAELTELGAADVKLTATGAEFYGELEQAYRACLWSRLANRILLPIAEENVETADQLYDAVQSVDWLEHMRPEASLLVAFTGKTDAINHTHFGALKVKDAIVDQIRDKTQMRPSIDRENPDLRVHAHIYRGKLTLSLDLSGGSLHRRGYRIRAGMAPLKENLAAAILRRAQWPELAVDHPVLFDPMCGSGTLVIEGVLMAADIAPGILREQFGFERWVQHQPELWESLLAEAEQRKEAGLAQLTTRFYGYDQDSEVLVLAKDNAERAGVDHLISFKKASVEQMVVPENAPGLMVTNPPYGERMGESQELMFLYRHIGDALKQDFAGWKAAIFTGNPDLCQVVGLKADKSYSLNNGPIDGRLFLYTLYTDRATTAKHDDEQEAGTLSDNAQMFANRLKKNLKALKKWHKQEEIECYRLYDADMPEYAVAVDLYKEWVHVQEYAAPASIDKVKAFDRIKDVLAAIPEALGVDPRRIILKQRKKQSGSDQYGKQASVGRFFEVKEHGCRLRINLHDYLDTGLFLDHRPIRHQIQEMAAGKDFLNLFCYTASASVHAAVGGAKSTTSVDMSTTYLQWAMKNMALNGFNNKAHHFIEADCISWLKKQRKPEYDLIFMDPPTFSNSKKMLDVLDVQRDHIDLIKLAMRLLRKDGVLIFSNNYRRFKMDYELLAGFDIREITAKTIDPDFKRNTRIHSCFEIRWP
ncbi:bifunctional 23S rRNA (guanine(2069)-N(7))-methyltransferase RlmK/23S rRNA (guanine(2445)-N(2))-methyltransferase RlmL [Neptunomonas antarctica]|uniref:Ribosomal RNA large subunit methyltransferase K/L n=1 Tax=Neptunomonas antarctica TaxID=619304 RepID=A0A1N7KFW3_9GAMM|nr:bifunctional 23S rRNA (guanine(2069)-N(7))-methyltransferase RlmK/23S rRNA (guanine(2445)-N(2))-methyltransferase RlmL [Neptunomonas antarctica]SIS60364.1 23S rRNA m(2)G-2445 methyltransferase [Neptunomonas antarctica]